jgi:uncharacterized membrane protein
METHFNQIAARDVSRISNLSDSIFGVAMTVLMLGVHFPQTEEIHSEQELIAALGQLAPHVIIWLMSVLTLGMFWVGQHTQLDQLERSDRDLSWLHFLFLAIVTVMPFTTQLLAEFITFHAAFFLYWMNLAAAGLSLYGCWAYSERAKLTPRDLEPAVSKAIRRRLVTAQALYALGAVIGYFDPPVGVGAIFLTQLNYAIAPRLPFLSRL